MTVVTTAEGRACADVPEREGRRIVRERSGGLCEIRLPGLCLQRVGGVHHRLPRSGGGPWCACNLLGACGSGTTGCHGWVEGHPALAYALGLKVRRGDDPCPTPALTWPNGLHRAYWHPLCGGGWELAFAFFASSRIAGELAATLPASL
jgi:hypothetical protein